MHLFVHGIVQFIAFAHHGLHYRFEVLNGLVDKSKRLDYIIIDPFRPISNTVRNLIEITQNLDYIDQGHAQKNHQQQKSDSERDVQK